MQRLEKFAVYAVVGAIVGEIFLVPFLGWPYSGHNGVTVEWSRVFLIVGSVWGSACGIAIRLVDLAAHSKSLRRSGIGIILGCLAGAAFFLIGDLAFPGKVEMNTALQKALVGAAIGSLDGAICAVVIGGVIWLLKWMTLDTKIVDHNRSEYSFAARMLDRYFQSGRRCGAGRSSSFHRWICLAFSLRRFLFQYHPVLSCCTRTHVGYDPSGIR